MATNNKKMKKIFAFLSLALAFSVFSASALVQSERRFQKDYKISGFNAVDISGDFIVEISQGPYAVSLDLPEEYAKHVVVRLDEDELEIYYNERTMGVKHFLNRSKLRSYARISLPSPEEISISGATKLDMQKIKVSNLSIDCDGASEMKLSGDFGMLDFECSGAFKGSVSGTARVFDVEMSGAANLDAMDLVSNRADVEMSGAGGLKVNATDNLSLECSGASKVEYKILDDTILRVENSGASKISRVR